MLSLLFNVIFFCFLEVPFSDLQQSHESLLCFFLVSSDGELLCWWHLQSTVVGREQGRKTVGLAVWGACHRARDGSHMGERFAAFCAPFRCASAEISVLTGVWRNDRNRAQESMAGQLSQQEMGEAFFLVYSPFWIIVLLGVVVPFRLYERFQEREYLLLGLLTVAPCFLVPLFIVCKEDAKRPFYRRYWFKANVWIAIFGFVGNYFWTHYFYTVLGAIYTFPSYKINHVPITTFLLTQSYFLLYHAVSNMTLRRLEHAIKDIPDRYIRWLIQASWVLVLSYITALTEALTISHFPYYEMVDRSTFYKVGSVFYAIYFIVSFPMFKRMDEDPNVPWTLSQVAIDALGASMLVTIILDFWRITVGPIVDIPWSASQSECLQFGPPWLRPSSDIKGVKDSYNWTSSGMTQESYGLSRLRERATAPHVEL